MKTETLRVRNVVDATRFMGAWLQAGEGIGWLAAGTMPNSLYRMPLVYLFLACVFCYSCSFLFVVFCVFVLFLVLSLELGRCSSDLFLSSRPRTGLATTCITGYVVVVVVVFTLTDRASTIPSNIRGCQSGTWSQRGTKVNGSEARSVNVKKTTSLIFL